MEIVDVRHSQACVDVPYGKSYEVVNQNRATVWIALEHPENVGRSVLGATGN